MNTFGKRGTTASSYALHRLPSPKSDPWIFYSHGKRNRSHTFYSLSERRVHNKCLKEMLYTDILCSMHGWLVLCDQNDHRSVRLFNPVSMVTIQLPLFSRPCCYDFGALSCDPNNPDCIVMLIKYSRPRSTYCFCRPGDINWNEHDLEMEVMEVMKGRGPDNMRALGCYKGQICIFSRFEKIFLLHANPPYLTLTNLEVDDTIPCNPGHFGGFQDYLVESDGELFVIQKFDLRVDAYDFVVSKVDINGKKKRFVNVNDLGGRAFFLSSSSSGISCSVENCGIKANTIYFTEPFDPCIYSFDLKNKVITFSLPCPNVKRNLVQAEWILPLPLNAPCKPDCKAGIVAPLQVQKSIMVQLSIIISLGKDWSQLQDVIANSVEEKLSSRSTGRDWSGLPHDVLISIAEKMSCVSCARASMVCKSWGSVITWAPKKLLGCPLFLHMPSLSLSHFIPNGESGLDDSDVFSIQHAKYGWLLMTTYSGKKIFFLNPLTTEKIEIPDLPIRQIRGLCFTSLPTSSKCSVLGIYEGISCYSIYHIRRGEREWTKVVIPKADVGDYKLIPYSNPLFHNGVFYWIWRSGNLCAYDPMKGAVEFFADPQSPCRYVHMNYLFESEEKLMSVWVGRHGKWVRVYELDEASMAWKEVNTLGNKAVFLSRNSSLVIDYLEMPGFEDMIIFNRFTGDNRPIFYSLKTRELGVYDGGHHVIQNFCDIPEYHLKSAWIKPNIKQHSVRKLSWYDVVFNISQIFVTH